jgi:hypothetical protein
MIKAILAAIIAIIAIIVLVIFILPTAAVKQENTTAPNQSVTNVPSVINPQINLSSLYWSFSGEATQNSNVCSNKSRLNTNEFTITGSSNVNLAQLEGCYIKLNGQKTSSTIRILTNELKVSAQALTHFENSAQACCDYQNKSYCTQTTNITVCPLNLTDIELPSVGKRCKVFSDCTGYCETILSDFTPNNCGNPYSFCGSHEFCACACLNTSYKLS